MSTEQNELIGEIVDATTRHIVQLQARCDALAALVLVLGKQLGAEPEKLREALGTVQATAYHKRLETLEDQSPTSAARLDQREDLSNVDWDLLKHLRFHS
jgi:hypothetical protein